MEQESAASAEGGAERMESTVASAAAILVNAATSGQQPHHPLNSRDEDDVQHCPSSNSHESMLLRTVYGCV